jgi:cobalt-zinc-cadmium efflux system membrane fusion protein
MRRVNREWRTLARVIGFVAGLGIGCGDAGAPAAKDAASETAVAVEVARGTDAERASPPDRVSLTPEQVRAAGIETAIAGPVTVRVMRPLSGRVVANEDALAHVAPRFPGIVRSVHKHIGDAVAEGDLLAVIESNESLHPYEIRARLAGVVLERDVAPGEFVSTDRPILTVGNLSTVWVDLDVYRRDFAHLARGQRVWVDAEDGRAPAEAVISYLAPIGAENTQTLVARAVLANADGRWRPGQFVSARVLVQAVAAAVAVPLAAVQRLGEDQVVFVADGDVFEAQPVELGARDEESVEIVATGSSP